jgi:hypothetical protein
MQLAEILIDNNLVKCDLEGPRIILRATFVEEKKQKQNKGDVDSKLNRG